MTRPEAAAQHIEQVASIQGDLLQPQQPGDAAGDREPRPGRRFLGVHLPDQLAEGLLNGGRLQIRLELNRDRGQGAKDGPALGCPSRQSGQLRCDSPGHGLGMALGRLLARTYAPPRHLGEVLGEGSLSVVLWALALLIADRLAVLRAFGHDWYAEGRSLAAAVLGGEPYRAATALTSARR